jgi:hypothetical protein
MFVPLLSEKEFPILLMLWDFENITHHDIAVDYQELTGKFKFEFN